MPIPSTKNLDDLQREVAEKELRLREKEEAELKHAELLDELGKLKETLENKTLSVEVKNPTPPVESVRVENLEDIKIPHVRIPETVTVKNLKDIPAFPKEISVKEPRWYTFKGVLDAIREVKQAIIKLPMLDFDRYKKKQNALAVRLVLKDGSDYYNAAGGGGGGGGGAGSGSVFDEQDSINIEAVRTNTGLLLADFEDVTHVNTHTGSDELRVYQENHLCTQNSTTTPLEANATFTGEWEDCLNYQEVNVSIVASHNSASNGLVMQWSSDGVNVGDTDVFSYYAASGGTNYTPNPAFRYFRLVYTNGATKQTSFALTTILRRSVTGGSFHRIDSTLKDDSDARLTLAVPKLKTAANTYVSQTATTAGNAKISLEEFDDSLESSPLPVKISDGADIAEVIAGANTGVKGLRVYGGPTDPISDIPVVMEFDHHQLHEGETFRYGFYTASLGNGANKDIRFTVPNIGLTGSSAVIKCPHFRWEVISSVGGVAYIYEATTFSNNGTTRTPIPLERNGSYTPKLTLGEDPTVNVLGSQIWLGLLITAKAQAGGADDPSHEFVLKNNTDYLFRFTSAGATNQVLIRFVWYEDLGV